MYAVTQEFLDQMRAPVRKVLARVTIDYTDPVEDQTIEVAASEQANASYPAQTADFATEPTYKWASLDGSWVLDGTYHLAPIPEDAYRYQMGWWSAQVAGADGRFAEPSPTLILTHPARPVLTYQVIGDALREEWPVEFAIRLYGPDGTLVRERVVTGNAEIQFDELLDPPALDVTRQELEIRAWSHPGRHAKILEFFTSLQETYEGDDLVQLHLLEESESGNGVGTGGVSTNEITVRLVNRGERFDVTNPQSPFRELLRPNRRVRAWLGGELTENLCPGFQFWELGGSAEVTPDGVLHLNAYGDYARSPLIRVDGAARWTFSAEYYAEEPGPVFGSNPDGTDASRLLNSSYYAEDGITPATNSAGYTGNGNAGAFPVGVWSESSWTGHGGPDVAFIRIQIQSSSSWTSPRYSVRRPSMTTKDPAIIRKEWVPLGTYWSTEWDSRGDVMEAQVRARDRLELLRRTSYRPGPLRQNVSLYALAEDVLADAELAPEFYSLDPALQDIVVPWGWVPPGSHRDALRVIAEAGLARVYSDRDGILRVQTVAQPGGSPVVEITADDYFPPLRAPASGALVANRVVVTTRPLVPAASPEEVYRATVEVPAGATIPVRGEYEKRPVIDAAASLENPPAGVSIVEASYGAAGAEVQIRNAGAGTESVILVITGRPLSVEGGEQVVEEDDLSIRELGLIVHEVPSNPLAQTTDRASAIAQAILAASAQQRRDVEIEWRGNPALEVGDLVRVVGMDAEVVRQEMSWAGALSARLTGRRVTS